MNQQLPAIYKMAQQLDGGCRSNHSLKPPLKSNLRKNKHLEIVAVMVNHFLLNKFTKMQQYLMIQRYEMTCHVIVICHFLSLHTEELSLLPFHLSKLSNNTFYYIPKQNGSLFSGINDGDENKDENNIMEEDAIQSTPPSLHLAEYESRDGEKRTDAAEGGRRTMDDVPVANEEDACVGEGKPYTLLSSFRVCV